MPLCSKRTRLAAAVLLIAACGPHEPLADTRAQPVASTIDFAVAPPSLSLGFVPAGFAVADFDGDGHPEIATAGGSTGAILASTPNGRLTRRSSFQVGQSISGLVAGDFDGDGHVDLAMADQSGVLVLRGRGNGSFDPPRTFSVGGAPGAIVVGDFDRDGKLDIATWTPQSGGVSVLLGRGDGTFQPSRSFPGAPNALVLAAGDVDGDGKLDLILVDRYSAVSLFGNGEGSFRTAPPVDHVPEGMRSDQWGKGAAVGDFNADGKLDLAIAYAWTSGDNPVGGAELRLGQGDGSFQRVDTQRSSTGDDVNLRPIAVAAGDLDGDGKLDVVTAADRGDMLITSLGQGDGHLRTNDCHAVVAKRVVAADVDGDGKAAVLAAIDDRVTLLRSRGDGLLNAPRAHPFNGPVGRLATGDFDGDGTLDVAVTWAGEIDAVKVLLGNGLGGLHAAGGAALWGGSDYRADVAAVDLNGDGKLDVVAAESASVSLGKGDGTLQPPRRGTEALTRSPLAVGDFDGDGEPDLVVERLGATPDLVLLRGKGDGSFEAPRPIAVDGKTKSAVAADFDGDGRSDLAVSTGTGLFLLTGLRDGGFAPARRAAGIASPAALAVADLDGNGTPDLVVAHADGPLSTVLLDAGGSQPRIAGMLGASGIIRIGDADGDGIRDVVVHDGSLAVFRGRGDGTFEAAGRFDVGGTAFDVAFLDIDGDGLPELLVTPGWRSPAWTGWRPHYLISVRNCTRSAGGPTTP